MATATALWSPLRAPADIARQGSRSDAVSSSESFSARNAGLLSRSEDVHHSERRSCGENQRENFYSTQDNVMDRLCGQLEELLKRVSAVGPSQNVLRTPHDGASRFTRLTPGSSAARAGELLSRGPADDSTSQPPTWGSTKKEVLNAKSHIAANDRYLDERWPAPDATQWGRGSPEVDHFFKTKICPFIKSGGICLRNSACTFAHSMDELRPQPSFRKTKLCRYSNAGQICSRGENCSFAHSVHELKPLQVPPFRRKHQTVPFRSSFASPAAHATGTYRTAARVHSQVASSEGTAAGRSLRASAATEPAQGSHVQENTPVLSAGQGGAWQGSGVNGDDGTAQNSGSCPGAPSCQAQQQFLYSDLHRLSKATIGSLLASVQETDTGCPVPGLALSAAEGAQKRLPSVSGLPSDSHALQRYMRPHAVSPLASGASPRGRPSLHVSPATFEQPRQQAQRLQHREGMVTKLPFAQKSGPHQPPAAALGPFVQQHNREEDRRRVRFVAEGSLQEPQHKVSTASISKQEQQPAVPTTSAAPAPACSPKQEDQQHLVAAAIAAGLCHREDRSWLKKAPVDVGDLWHSRCRSPLPGACTNPNMQTPDNSPVSLAVEVDGLCNHLAAGRSMKKSRRGKRGGRKKRGAGHPPGGSTIEQQGPLAVEQQKRQETPDEQQTGDSRELLEEACKNSNTSSRHSRYLFGEAKTHETMNLFLQRGDGSGASTCFSEGTPSTSGGGEGCTPSGVFPGSSAGDAFLYLLDPIQKERAKVLEGLEEESNSENQGAQLLLEALHVHATAVGESAIKNSDLEVAAPPLLLSAAPATAAVSPLSAVAKTFSNGKSFPEEEENKEIAAILPKKETDAVPLCGQARQLETPQQILKELLQGGEMQQLLVQCIRDIMRQTPPLSSPSEVLSALQLLNSSFSSHVAAAHNSAAGAGASNEAAKTREMHAITAAREQRGDEGVLGGGCFTGEKKWCSDDSKCSVFPAEDEKRLFSPLDDFNFSFLEKNKEALNDCRTTSVDVNSGTVAGGPVASILELLTDEDDSTETTSAVGQQQASTRSSSRCGPSQEEAGALLFGGSPAEAGNPILRSSLGGSRPGRAAGAAPGGYVPGFFTPTYSAAATTSTSYSPWV